MNLRIMTAVSLFAVMASGASCLAERAPAVEMRQIMDDLREKWRVLDDGYAYEGEAFEANYLEGKIDPATGGAAGIHVAAKPIENRSHASVESSGAIYSVLQISPGGNRQRYHFGLDEVFYVVGRDRIGNHEQRTVDTELRAISEPIFTPDRLWNEWLEYPWPKQYLRPDPTRTLTTKILSATANEIVEEIECARLDKMGGRIAQHTEFVAKPVKDFGWLPVEVRNVYDGHVMRSHKLTWAAIKIGDALVPIPEQIEIKSEHFDADTRQWLRGDELGLKIDMATFITPLTVKDDKRPWAEVEERDAKLAAQLPPPAPKATAVTN